MINNILIVVSTLIFIVVIALLYMRAKTQKGTKQQDNFNTIEKVLEAIKSDMIDTLKDDFSLGLSVEEFDKLYKRKAKVNEALKNCVYGIREAKIFIMSLIRDFIDKKVPHEKVTELLGLDENHSPSNHVKFEILMYIYKSKHDKQALAKWIENNELDKEKPSTEYDNTDLAYYITEEELNLSYDKENINLNIEQQIDILAILVYQMYKGFGIVDTIHEMDINGYNCGTSGSILNITNSMIAGTFKSNKSIWVFYNGKYIHLRFMDFGTEEELRRIIQLIIRYGNPGPLTAKRGYIVTTMYDKSRVLAIRPPASEHWAVFVRKFTLTNVAPEELYMRPYVHRGDIPIKLMEFLIKGEITCGLTGAQGSGKTTLLSSIVRYIDPRFTIRVLEMAPELYLREIYPTRNILSVQETVTVSATELQDALKKADGIVSIVGEVATDSIASNMIKMGQVASKFTIFTHHANTAKDLVIALRNSLVNAGNFNNTYTAEKQVTDIVKIDIHIDKTADGRRYIERISEVIQKEEGVPYPDYNINDPINSMNEITREYYARITDRLGFVTQDLIVYDLETDTYKVVNRPSEYLEDRIKKRLNNQKRIEFERFLSREWDCNEDNSNSDIQASYVATPIENTYNKLESQQEIYAINKLARELETEDNKYSIGLFFDEEE